MSQTMPVRVLFTLNALYDGVLGMAFLFAAERVLRWAQITPPNHLGYVEFPGAQLIVFALMCLAIAAMPLKNRNLIPYVILLKASYCGVVFYHWHIGGIPLLWKAFAVADAGFAILFVWAYLSLFGAKRVPSDPVR